jgi:PAS domain S-box-containing protein
MSPSNDNSTITILVVEDDEGLNRLAQKKLKQHGFQTRGTTTGKEALTLMKEIENPLLLLDYMLPDITGEDVIRIMGEENLRIPFIMMSGRGSEKIAVEMMKLGARDYIVKDTSFLEFLPQVVKQTVETINTERKLAKTVATLEESENKYQALIENAMDAIYILQDNRFVFVNNAFCSMFGYSQEEIQKLDTFLNLVGEESHDYIRERAAQLNRGEQVDQHYEFVGRKKNGEKLYLDAAIGSIVFEGRKARQGMLRDVSDRKKDEEQKAELEKVKSDFMLLVSHELGTPLMVIDLSIENLKYYGDELTAEEKEETFEKLNLNIERIKKLKSFMSNMIFLEKQKFKPRKEPMFLHHVARQSMSELEPLAGKKEIEMRFDLGELDIIEADTERIHEVLSTLIDNAIRYTPVGGRITIGGSQDEANVELTVQDNGIGIAPSEHERIFERFYQIQDILTHKDGFGLGLSIARGIIESHGGRIWVESIPRKGSTFHFTLPKVDPDAEDVHDELNAGNEMAGTSNAGNSTRARQDEEEPVFELDFSSV